MSLLSPTIKTFNPTSFTLQIISCHTAAFCQKIILEFVARCRWNGKKYFWATLLRTLKTFHPTSVILPHFAGKKIISHFETTDSSLRSIDISEFCDILLVQTCSNLSVPLPTFASLVLTILQRNISDLKSRNLDNTHSFFLVSSIQNPNGSVVRILAQKKMNTQVLIEN